MNIDSTHLQAETPHTNFTQSEKPFFHTLKPDFEAIEALAKQYDQYTHIVLLGNGGAVNSFNVIYRALYNGDKHVSIITSMEPDLIEKTKKNNPVGETVVIVSSTSGTNVGVLETMTAFMKYPLVIITAENDAPLRNIAITKNIDHLFVPHITDRYLTSSALAYFPLTLLGINTRKLDEALHNAYEQYAPDKTENNALILSAKLYQLEEQGYTEIYMPIYSYQLEGFAIYITQLMHESVNKNGKGQTCFVVGAPESQHHSNQRFFGGRQNMAGLFVRVTKQHANITTQFPEALEHYTLRDGTLRDINHTPLTKSFEFEFTGTYQDAIGNNIPAGVITLDAVDEKNVADFIAFWHYMAVYSSWMRDVNPFDQPQVEKSKQIAFSLRKQYRKKNTP